MGMMQGWRRTSQTLALLAGCGFAGAIQAEPPPEAPAPATTTTPATKPDEGTPPQAPAPEPRNLEPVRRIKPSRDAAPPPAQPVNPISDQNTIPGLENTDLMLRAAPLRGEGTFLSRQRGTLVITPTGEAAFVFHADELGVRERPMVLLPCQTLQRMRKLVADRGTPTSFNISGQVFVYLDLNYLLPTAYSIVGEETPKTPQDTTALTEKPTSESATKAGAEQAKSLESDPQLHDLIASLEAQRARPRSLGDRPSTQAAAPATNSKNGSRAEGTSILRRRGRLVRENDGQWSLVFDTGPKGDSATDAPITLMPSLTLQRMESWASNAGEAATFTVSGNVYLYEGRNYLMPAAFTINRTTGDVTPHQ